MISKKPHPRTVAALISYNADTGALTWKRRPRTYCATDKSHKTWNGRHAGKPAMTATDTRGYLHGKLLGRMYRAHQIAWALHHGHWPTGDIDHINGNKCDNRISNLRCVTRSENSRNAALSRSNKSGVNGVHWDERLRKWAAQIRVNYKTIRLGQYDTLEKAAKARAKAEIEYGFHPNHGRAA